MAPLSLREASPPPLQLHELGARYRSESLPIDTVEACLKRSLSAISQSSRTSYEGLALAERFMAQEVDDHAPWHSNSSVKRSPSWNYGPPARYTSPKLFSEKGTTIAGSSPLIGMEDYSGRTAMDSDHSTIPPSSPPHQSNYLSRFEELLGPTDSATGKPKSHSSGSLFGIGSVEDAFTLPLPASRTATGSLIRQTSSSSTEPRLMPLPSSSSLENCSMSAAHIPNEQSLDLSEFGSWATIEDKERAANMSFNSSANMNEGDSLPEQSSTLSEAETKALGTPCNPHNLDPASNACSLSLCEDDRYSVENSINSNSASKDPSSSLVPPQKTEIRDIKAICSHLLEEIERELHDQPEAIDKFSTIMKDYYRQLISTNDVVYQAAKLFIGHPKLMYAFNSLLPQGYMIEYSNDPEDTSVTVVRPDGRFGIVKAEPLCIGSSSDRNWPMLGECATPQPETFKRIVGVLEIPCMQLSLPVHEKYQAWCSKDDSLSVVSQQVPASLEIEEEGVFLQKGLRAGLADNCSESLQAEGTNAHASVKSDRTQSLPTHQASKKSIGSPLAGSIHTDPAAPFDSDFPLLPTPRPSQPIRQELDNLKQIVDLFDDRVFSHKTGNTTVAPPESQIKSPNTSTFGDRQTIPSETLEIHQAIAYNIECMRQRFSLDNARAAIDALSKRNPQRMEM